MKSIMEKEERKARGYSWSGGKWKDQRNGYPNKVEELSSLGQIWRLKSEGGMPDCIILEGRAIPDDEASDDRT